MYICIYIYIYLVLSFSALSHDVSVPLSKRFSRSHTSHSISLTRSPTDLSLADPTPPFNLHINPTRRNWRVFKRADLEFFRRRDALRRRRSTTTRWLASEIIVRVSPFFARI